MPKIARITSYLSLTFLTLCYSLSFGQEVYPETIESDRPGQAYSSFALPKGFIQLQIGSGLNYDKYSSKKFTISSRTNYVVRYGLLENLDLQYSLYPNWSLTRNKKDLGESYEYQSDYAPELLNFAFRYQVYRGSGMLEALAVYFELNVQDVIEGNFTDNPTGNSQIRISAKHKASNKISLTTNLAVIDLQADDRSYNYVINGSYGIGDGWGIFADVFGFFTEHSHRHSLDAGLFWQVNSDLQFDAFAGWSYASKGSDINEQPFGELGISYRLPAKKKTRL